MCGWGTRQKSSDVRRADILVGVGKSVRSVGCRRGVVAERGH